MLRNCIFLYPKIHDLLSDSLLFSKYKTVCIKFKGMMEYVFLNPCVIFENYQEMCLKIKAFCCSPQLESAS